MTAPDKANQPDGTDPAIDHSITRILNDAGGNGVRLAESTEPSWSEAGDVDEAVRKLGEQASGKRYTIEKLIAKGGMGMVFNAQDLSVRRKIAMKVMRPEAEASADQVVRFIEEAQVTGQLEHPGIVPIYELGVDKTGNVYYTMKLIKGRTLKEILRGLARCDQTIIRDFPLTRLLTIFQKVCDAIAYAHNKHVVHRDLKPENIMIGEYGEVHIVDWGLAKVIDLAKAPTDVEIGADTDAMLEAVKSLRQDESHKGYATLHGQVLGTPKYMAPEQAMGVVDAIDARTDVYALGAILYNILTLASPVAGDSVHALLTKVILGEIVAPSQFNVGGTHETELPHCPSNRIPDGLAAVAMKAMATKKEDRYQSVAKLQSDVYSWMNGFAPDAENAGLGRQARLFIHRHKPMVAMATFSILVIYALLIFVAVTAKRGETKALAAMQEAELARKEAEAAKVVIAESEEKLKTIAQKTAAETWNKVMDCFKSDDLTQAQEHLDLCERLSPEDPKVLLMKGRLELLKLNLKEAKKYFIEYKKRAKDSQADEYLGILEQLEMASADLLAMTDESAARDTMEELDGDFKNNETILAGKPGSQIFDEKRDMPAKSLNVEAELAEIEQADKEVTAPQKSKGKKRKEGSAERIVNSPDSSTTVRKEEKKIDYRSKATQQTPSPMALRRQKMEFVASKLAESKDQILAANMYKRLGHQERALALQAGVVKTELKKQTAANEQAQVQTMTSGYTLQITLPENADIQDVTVLNGMPVQELNIARAKLRDLGRLRLSSLKSLQAEGSDLVDVSVLASMPITEINLANTKVKDFSTLRGMKLTKLDLSGTGVKNVEWLNGMPLQTLVLSNTAVSDLTPLANLPLVEVDLRDTKVTDFSTLKSIPTLKRINGMDVTEFWKSK